MKRIIQAWNTYCQFIDSLSLAAQVVVVFVLLVVLILLLI
jgi:hypothetical protein